MNPATYGPFTASSMPGRAASAHSLRSLIVLNMAGHPPLDKDTGPDREFKARFHSEAF